VAPLLASADLFLVPSNRESFGLSALEALSCGVPVIGCNVGGLPEVVRQPAGMLLAPGDIDGLSAAALGILCDETRWQAMSDLAAADARARFSEDAIVPLYEALYRKAVADRPRPASARPVTT
jgi:glycosyltransferase involved in cell wall biosynthesis